MKATVQFISRKPTVEKGIGLFVNRAVEKSVKVIEKNVKVETPVRHGYLRRSITSKMTGFGKGEVFTNPISNVTKATSKRKSIAQHKEVSYAVYVEYGTRHMAPRAMFRKGVGKSERQIKQIFKDEAKSFKDAGSEK